MPVFVKTKRNGQASVDQGFSTASQGSCHVQQHPVIDTLYDP